MMRRWELKQGYEEVFGPIRSVSASEYGKFTGSSMKRGIGKSTSAPELSRARPASKKTKARKEQLQGSVASNGGDSDLNASTSLTTVLTYSTVQAQPTPEISRVPLASRRAPRKRKASWGALSDATEANSSSPIVVDASFASSASSVAVVKSGTADVVSSSSIEIAADGRAGRRTRRKIRYP